MSRLVGRESQLAATQADETLAFGRAAKLYQFALKLTPASAEDSRIVRIKLADALADAAASCDAVSLDLFASPVG